MNSNKRGGILIEPLTNGDFRSAECLATLKEVDIVITNPPFSLFREFIDVLIRYQKDFIVLGSLNAYTYPQVFNGIVNKTINIGYTIRKGEVAFEMPEEYHSYYRNTGVTEDGRKLLHANVR